MKIGVTVPAAASDSDGGRPSWPAIASFARAAEAHGLDSVWMFDHFFHKLSSGPIDGQLEAWTVVSALAAATERVEIGTLVLCSSFRHPSVVAKMAAPADEVSGGRLILGLGAGWHDPDIVDAFITEVREELIRESLDRAEQAAWEERMDINAVLDPVPVRVDARMRPVTS